MKMNTKKVLRRAGISLLLCAALTASALLCSCGGGKNTVMTIGDYEVSFEHYRYLYMNVSAELSESGMTAEEIDAEARKVALTSLEHTASIKKMADERKVSLDSDEQKSVDDYVKAAIEQYGSREEFEKAMAEAYLCEEFFRDALELQNLESKLRSYMTDEFTGELAASDAVIEEDVYKNFFYAAQILIKNDLVDTPAKNLETAKEALERAKNGEDFDALIKEYGEDGTGGYYCFTSGQLIEEIETAVTSLSEGELYSSVIETEAGYHVVKRLPIDPEFVNENFDDIRDAYLARRFNELQAEVISSLEVKTTALFDSLTFDILSSGILPEETK